MPTPQCIAISATVYFGVVGYAAAADLPCWEVNGQTICREEPHEAPVRPEDNVPGEAEAESPDMAEEPQYAPFEPQSYPANGGGQGMVDAPAAGIVRTSRSFLGPHAFPPEEFAAYGIVVFPARAAEATRQRHLAACEAYVATLPTPAELFIPEDEQMVTAWPVDDEELAADLIDRPDDQVCGTAVARYDLTTALTALRHAQAAADLSI